MSFNNVKIAGIILCVIGVLISSIFMKIDFGMIQAILIGLGAGLSVYKQRDKE